MRMRSAFLNVAAARDIFARTARALSAAWAMRHAHTPLERTPLERKFLPAALEIIDTPAPALPRAIILTIACAFVLAILWATVGHIDMVAIAPGRIIAADKAKVIQPAETAVVKRILVRDGQAVAAGEVLVELEAATATAAETAPASPPWTPKSPNAAPNLPRRRNWPPNLPRPPPSPNAAPRITRT